MTVSDLTVELVTGYIRAGLPVLPLHSMEGGPGASRCSCRRDCGNNAAKHPRTRNGKDDATTDPGQVAEWLVEWPTCNWGVRPPLGVVVLDIDPRNGGMDSLSRLELENGPLPLTLTAKTGSGGLHYWLSYNGPARGKLADGIDVKSNSGYLVAPPSVHKCGGTYEWLDSRPAAYAPEWVKRLLNPPARVFVGPAGKGARRIEPLVKFVRESVEGERNGRLYWAACRAHEAGLDPTPLLDAATANGTPAGEAAATIRSAASAAPRASRKAS